MTDKKPAKTVAVPKLGNLQLLNASETAGGWGLTMLIFGPSGAGKTTLAASAQDSEYGKDVLYIDVEGGSKAISDREDIAVFRPKTLADIRAAFKALQAEADSPFKTVVIDSLTALQQFAAKEVVGDTQAGISQPQWNVINDKLAQIVRAFAGLADTRGINSIFTALEREVITDTVVYVRPDLTPGSAKSVMAAVDCVAYLSFSERNNKRLLMLQGTARITAKVRQPLTAKLLPTKIEDPSLGIILDALRGKKPLPEPAE